MVRNLIASADTLQRWVRQLATSQTTLFPQPHGSASFAFAPVDGHTEVRFDGYRPTITPPGKQLSPDREVLFTFRRGADGRIELTPGGDRTRRVLAGVRPCDLKAIAEMDAVMAAGSPDPLYLERRANTAIIAVNCLKPCDGHCFCAATGSLAFRGGADVYLTPLDDGLLVEALSERGGELLATLDGKPTDDADALRRRAEAARPQPFGRQLTLPVERLADLLRQHYRSPIYDRYAERCYSCGTCNLVCPTCYCFEVCDDLNLDTASGNRTRTADACMNPQFAEVAGGHSFRAATGARQRHRIKRKFEYLPQRFPQFGSFCVGCGRCGRQCTTGIDIFDMVNDIAAEAGGAP